MSTKNKTSDTLEELVRKANEGLAAIWKLDPNSVELVGQEFGRMSLGSIRLPQEIRIKPSPAFAPFIVGENCKVAIKGTILYIGSQLYVAELVKIHLNELIRSNAASTSCFQATRKGVVQEDGYCITWEEAEKILKALEGAGV